MSERRGAVMMMGGKEVRNVQGREEGRGGVVDEVAIGSIWSRSCCAEERLT